MCPFYESGKKRLRQWTCSPEVLYYEVTEPSYNSDDSNTFQNPYASRWAMNACVDSNMKLINRSDYVEAQKCAWPRADPLNSQAVGTIILILFCR